ncbi:dimethyl sulfoxide reductase anchor subunit [Aquamicrobium lusatiense]|uniref:dimethyl sulfoxide reductase anchor subunit family protein n=2 Tax=Aquamicrobium TaxID=69278 RepID=UPI002454FA7A|nr:DmsC/YnfH family molybdoenzyme membrane anchor subunit [Aquamicrobium lusatiense]MDH4990410.1 dimethyl sulfoxide reductase anchor subunit [Aquamicrobium lusatiense]
MHPAPSIILFTTLSGLGYGLAAMLGLGLLDPAHIATKVGHLLALALIAAGLLSSTAHLGNPQRAWRALSQWRSSWLSREGVMAIATFIPLTWSAWLAVIESSYVWMPGLLGTVMSAGTVICTAMIYASLRSVQAWNTRLTPACFLLFSAAGGLVFTAFLAACSGRLTPLKTVAALVMLAVAWAVKVKWRARMKELSPLSTPESATGLGSMGQVRLFERPHMTENYLTREMGFRVGRKHAAKLWNVALIAGAIMPAVLLVAAAAMGPGGAFAILFSALAALSFVLGILAERWLFFAEARHAVMNYY